MAADTATTILGLLLQGTGNNNNSWGTNLNNSVITPVENAICAGVTLSVTGGAYALTQANALYSTIVLSGTLVSDLTITAPATNNKWTFINNCAGAFYVLIKTAGNTAVNIPAGKSTDVFCDGTSMYRADRHLVGEYFFHAGSAVPAGALECNAQTPLRASAVDLFTALGTTHGVGNGTTTFTLPNGTTAGKFLRSRTGSVVFGTVQTNQNKSHTHTGSGTSSGVSADHTHTVSGSTAGMSANANHTHTSNAIRSTSSAGSGNDGIFVIPNGSAATIDVANTDHSHPFAVTSGTMSNDHTHTYSFTTSTGSADGTEARPENISGILCVRY